MSDSKSPYMQSLEIESEQPQGTPARAAPSGPLSKRRATDDRNVPFNHSVLTSTSKMFYEVAIAQDWTMNKTLTEAAKLLSTKFPIEERED
jgi:hypothetical protein